MQEMIEEGPITLENARHRFEPVRGHNKRGRLVQWDDRMPNVMYHMRLLGADVKSIAQALSISVATLETYINTRAVMFDAWKAGGDLADAFIAKRLFHKAAGYSHAAEKIFCNQGQVTRADYTEHYPPDTQAASFWLANRQPGKWRSVNKVELSNPDGTLTPPALQVNFLAPLPTTVIDSEE